MFNRYALGSFCGSAKTMNFRKRVDPLFLLAGSRSCATCFPNNIFVVVGNIATIFILFVPFHFSLLLVLFVLLVQPA